MVPRKSNGLLQSGGKSSRSHTPASARSTTSPAPSAKVGTSLKALANAATPSSVKETSMSTKLALVSDAILHPFSHKEPTNTDDAAQEDENVSGDDGDAGDEAAAEITEVVPTDPPVVLSKNNQQSESPASAAGGKEEVEDTTTEKPKPSKKEAATKKSPKKGIARPVPKRMTRITKSGKVTKPTSATTKQSKQAAPIKSKVAKSKETVNTKEEYDVEKILSSRLNKRLRNRLEYEVKWAGYEETTWEPASNVSGAPVLVASFHKRHPKADGPKE